MSGVYEEASGAHAQLAVELRDLGATYRGRETVPVLRNLNLKVRVGEIVGILGESGSGKTTLARVLAGKFRVKGSGGYEIRVSGQVRVNDFEVASLRRTERDRFATAVGFLHQDASAGLKLTATVAESIAVPLFVQDKHFDVGAAEQRVFQLLEAVHLPRSLAELRVPELSEGQRQRVALAQALVLGPSILIADEPTSGVDVPVRHAITEVLEHLHEDASFTAVLITHELSVLERLEATVAVLHLGELVASGSAKTVFETSTHPYVARLGAAIRCTEKGGFKASTKGEKNLPAKGKLPDLDSNQEPAG